MAESRKNPEWNKIVVAWHWWKSGWSIVESQKNSFCWKSRFYFCFLLVVGSTNLGSLLVWVFCSCTPIGFRDLQIQVKDLKFKIFHYKISLHRDRCWTLDDRDWPGLIAFRGCGGDSQNARTWIWNRVDCSLRAQAQTVCATARWYCSCADLLFLASKLTVIIWELSTRTGSWDDLHLPPTL